MTHLCKHEMSLCILRTSSSLIFVSSLSPRRSRELSAGVSQMPVNSYLSGRCQSKSETQSPKLNVRDSMSETQCQRLNVRDSMSETQCQRLNVRVRFTNLVMSICYASRLGVQFGIGVQKDSGLVVSSFPSRDCCKAFSESRLGTHSIYVLGRLLQHRGTDFFCPVGKAGRPSLWNSW